MAFFSARVSKPGRLVLLLILCILVLQESVALQHASAGIYNRKVLVEKEGNHVKGKKEGVFVASELRAVPAGPDPLHHNGGSPKEEPRTTP